MKVKVVRECCHFIFIVMLAFCTCGIHNPSNASKAVHELRSKMQALFPCTDLQIIQFLQSQSVVTPSRLLISCLGPRLCYGPLHIIIPVLVHLLHQAHEGRAWVTVI